MHFVDSQATQFFIDTAERVFLAAILCTAFEVFFPANQYSVRSRLRGALFFLCHLVFMTLTWRASTLAFQWLGIHPSISIDFSLPTRIDNKFLHESCAIAAGVIVAIIADFFYYWFHRLQHVNTFLWRFHAIHHSIQEMSAFNSNHHITEDLFRVPFVAIPLALIQFKSDTAPMVAVFLLSMQPTFEHSCTRLHLGPLRYIFGDTRFHRIHHSMEPEHWNVNFGSFTTIWDNVFRTAVFPKKGEWPKVGLNDQPEPVTLGDYIARPFFPPRREVHPIQEII